MPRVLTLALLAAAGASAYAFLYTPADLQRVAALIPVGGTEQASPRQQELLRSARAAVVIEGDQGTILAQQDAFTPYPVASLTKLISAMVVLDHQPDLDQRVTILPDEYTIRGGNLRLFGGETVTLRDLLLASIVGSANNAAFALPRAVQLSDEAFAAEMNRKAITLGLDTAHFVDAAGFDPKNVASAYDMARLAAYAFAHYPFIADAAAMPEVQIRASSGRAHVVRNSNSFLKELSPNTQSKTGYLDEALHCVVLAARNHDQRLVAVVLGHAEERGVVRDAQALLDAVPRVAGSSLSSSPGVP